MLSIRSTNSTSFKSNIFSSMEKKPVSTNEPVAISKPVVANDTALTNKQTLTDKFDAAKKSVTDIAKNVNTIVNVSNGVGKGLVEGSIVAGTIAVLGKNAKNADGKIIGTAVGIAKDAFSVLKVVPNTISKLWNKSPKDNVVSVFKSIPKGVKNLFSGIGKHKLTAAIATVAGLSVLAFRTVVGKVEANKANANLDHNTNQGHIK